MEQTSHTTIISIMSNIWVNYRRDEDWGDFVLDNGTEFAFAFGLDLENIQIDKASYQNILNVWQNLLEYAGVKEDNISDWNDFVDKVNK